MDAWVEQELARGVFPDQRLKTRLGRLLSDLGQRIGETVPMACQDWAATKAAYRFFSNPRVDENLILAGHFQATTGLRDYLRSHPDTARAYKAEKRRCRELHPADSNVYCDAKAGWIAVVVPGQTHLIIEKIPQNEFEEVVVPTRC